MAITHFIQFFLTVCFIFLLDKRHMEVEKWMSQNCHQAVFHTYFLKSEMTLNVEDLKKKKKFFTELSVHLCHNPKRTDIFNSLRIKNMFGKFRKAQVLLQHKNTFNH